MKADRKPAYLSETPCSECACRWRLVKGKRCMDCIPSQRARARRLERALRTLMKLAGVAP